MAVRPSAPRREPMSKVDTAWLRMEQPTNLMMITGVMMLDRQVDLDRLKRLVAKRFLAYRRFRQKAVDTGRSAHWLEDPDLDLDWHIRIAGLPGAGGKAELQRFVSQLASSPLDHSKPLWQFHLVEKYGAGSALVVRIHHCYADGIALVQVLLSLTDTHRVKERGTALHEVWLREDRGTVLDRLEKPPDAGLQQVLKVGEQVLDAAGTLLRDPMRMAWLMTEGSAITRELAHAVSLPDDPVTPLRGPLGVSKRVAWAEPLDLDEVKTIGRALGATVNDVLMATAAGALRGYLISRGYDPDGITIRATVPVNLRPLEHARKLGNRFGLVFLELPIGEANPLGRLERVAASMRELKGSRQAMVAFGLLAALGMGPASIQGPALELFSRKATAVATNVPGPQMPLYLAGARILDQMFWVPQSGSIGIGISILSYDGTVHFGLMADRKLIPDPDEVIERFGPEFEKLVLLTLMQDWDAPITAEAAEASCTDALEPPRRREPRRR